MKNKKLKKALKVYGLIGKSFCASAGGIGGFLIGGPLVALPGAFVGLVAGHFFEKCVIK